jgi:hypothetical protein
VVGGIVQCRAPARKRYRCLAGTVEASQRQLGGQGAYAPGLFVQIIDWSDSYVFPRLNALKERFRDDRNWRILLQKSKIKRL